LRGGPWITDPRNFEIYEKFYVALNSFLEDTKNYFSSFLKVDVYEYHEGTEEEIAGVVRKILESVEHTPNNIFLIGPPGTGKTSFVLSLFKSLREGSCELPPLPKGGLQESLCAYPLAYLDFSIIPKQDSFFGWFGATLRETIEAFVQTAKRCDCSAIKRSRETCFNLLKKLEEYLRKTEESLILLGIEASELAKYTSTEIQEFKEAYSEIIKSGREFRKNYMMLAIYFRKVLKECLLRSQKHPLLLIAIDNIEANPKLIDEAMILCKLVSPDPLTVCIVNVRDLNVYEKIILANFIDIKEGIHKIMSIETLEDRQYEMDLLKPISITETLEKVQSYSIPVEPLVDLCSFTISRGEKAQNLCDLDQIGIIRPYGIDVRKVDKMIPQSAPSYIASQMKNLLRNTVFSDMYRLNRCAYKLYEVMKYLSSEKDKDFWLKQLYLLSLSCSPHLHIIKSFEEVFNKKYLMYVSPWEDDELNVYGIDEVREFECIAKGLMYKATRLREETPPYLEEYTEPEIELYIHEPFFEPKLVLRLLQVVLDSVKKGDVRGIEYADVSDINCLLSFPLLDLKLHGELRTYSTNLLVNARFLTTTLMSAKIVSKLGEYISLIKKHIFVNKYVPALYYWKLTYLYEIFLSSPIVSEIVKNNWGMYNFSVFEFKTLREILGRLLNEIDWRDIDTKRQISKLRDHLEYGYGKILHEVIEKESSDDLEKILNCDGDALIVLTTLSALFMLLSLREVYSSNYTKESRLTEIAIVLKEIIDYCRERPPRDDVIERMFVFVLKFLKEELELTEIPKLKLPEDPELAAYSREVLLHYIKTLLNMVSLSKKLEEREEEKGGEGTSGRR